MIARVIDDSMFLPIPWTVEEEHMVWVGQRDGRQSDRANRGEVAWMEEVP